MRRIYTFFFYLLIPWVIGRLYWKGFSEPAYRQRIRERFFLNQTLKTKVEVWIHAVSLGEVVAATPLIEALLAQGKQILVTTMTCSGSNQVLTRLTNKVQHQYIPYDLPWCLKRFFKAYQPCVGLIMETELWPNLINQAQQAQIPILMINARLSDKAFNQYRKVRWMFKPVLDQLTQILTQSQEDAKKYLALGGEPEKIRVFGNLKFDLQIKPITNEKLKLKQRWGENRPVFIASSTHEGEEKELLNELKSLQAAIPNVLLLIAPRHPARFKTVYELCKQGGVRTALCSQATTVEEPIEILIIDSLGELMDFYKLSDYAFVGGSLVPIGGHNVLEPIAIGVPVFSGPYMNNSKSICRDLCEAKAMQIISNAKELISACSQLHKNAALRTAQVANASAVLSANQGCMARYLDKIEEVLRHCSAGLH